MSLHRFPPPSWTSIKRQFERAEIWGRVQTLGDMHGWSSTREWRVISGGFFKIQRLVGANGKSDRDAYGLLPWDLNRQFGAYERLLEVEEARHDRLFPRMPVERQYVIREGQQVRESFSDVLHRYNHDVATLKAAGIEPAVHPPDTYARRYPDSPAARRQKANVL